MPQELGTPEQSALSAAPPPGMLAAKVENFLESLAEPHPGQGVPSQWLERTSTSLSLPQSSQWNS